MKREENREQAGVAKVDSAGRSWYTAQFKRDIVARCLQPGASVAGIAVAHGLNPNLVRKWIERVLSKNRDWLIEHGAVTELFNAIGCPARQNRACAGDQLGFIVHTEIR